MRRAPWLLSLALAACYQPNLGSGRFRCDPPNPVCPEGQACIGGLCLDPREGDLAAAPDLPADDDLSAAPDLRSDAPDLAARDLAQPGDMAAGPCTKGGQLIAPDVYACKGGFIATGAASLCGPGYRLCLDSDEAKYAAMYMGMKGTDNCAAIGGFYAVMADGTIKGNGDGRCGDPNAGETAALVGCGTEDGVLTPGQACKSLKSFFPCGTIRDWSCASSLGNATHLALDGKGGVLCCKQ